MFKGNLVLHGTQGIYRNEYVVHTLLSMLLSQHSTICTATCVTAVTRNKQKERHKEDQEYSRPWVYVSKKPPLDTYESVLRDFCLSVMNL